MINSGERSWRFVEFFQRDNTLLRPDITHPHQLVPSYEVSSQRILRLVNLAVAMILARATLGVKQLADISFARSFP